MSSTPARRLVASTLLLLVCAASLFVPALEQPATPAVVHACLFLSPNTQSDLDLATAQRRLASEEQRRANQLAGNLLASLGVSGHRTHNALGEWEGQVENSLFVTLDRPTDPAALGCAAALFGLAAKQKAVLAFHANAQGDHVLAEFDLPGRSIDEVRALLDRHGMAARTLLPTANGWRAIVLAPRQQKGALQRVPGAVSFQTGSAVFLGGDTTGAASERYRETIRAYRTTQHVRPVETLSRRTEPTIDEKRKIRSTEEIAS